VIIKLQKLNVGDIMAKGKRKKRKKIKLRHIIIGVLIIYLLIVMFNQRKLMNNMKNKKANLESDISKLEKEIEELEDEIEDSDTLEFIEKTAREEHGLVKPREIIYIDRGKFKNSLLNFFNRDKK